MRKVQNLNICVDSVQLCLIILHWTETQTIFANPDIQHMHLQQTSHTELQQCLEVLGLITICQDFRVFFKTSDVV